MTLTTIGIDLAKSVFQLHGVDAHGEVLFRKKLRRNGVLDFLRGQCQIKRAVIGSPAKMPG